MLISITLCINSYSKWYFHYTKKEADTKTTSTSVVSNGHKIVRYNFPDKTELVEEYDVTTLELVGKLNASQKMEEAQRNWHRRGVDI
jgi:hypothetical protein